MIRKLLPPSCAAVAAGLFALACAPAPPATNTTANTTPAPAANASASPSAQAGGEEGADRPRTTRRAPGHAERRREGGRTRPHHRRRARPGVLENIAVHVRKVGAFPLIDIGSDRLTKRMFFDVPEKYDAQPRSSA